MQLREVSALGPEPFRGGGSSVLAAGFVRARVWGLCLFTVGFVVIDFVSLGFGWIRKAAEV